jgi:carbon storage regulator
MLVLSRKVGEEIKIGENITIKILEVEGNRVRIGITAPADVTIHRQEVWVLLHSGPNQPQP